MEGREKPVVSLRWRMQVSENTAERVLKRGSVY